MRRSVAILLVVIGGGSAAPAAGQERPGVAVALASGPVNFDLSGTGTTFATAVRANHVLTDRLSIEYGSLLARPAEQPGRSTLLVPEAMLRFTWRAGRFTPYVAGGGGAVMRHNRFRTDWDPSLAGAGGLQYRLTDAVSAQGEMRLRGIGTSFAGSTAEWLFGVVWTPVRS